MCELRKNQVFAEDIPWNEQIEQKLKDTVQLLVKPELRKMIVQEQLQGKAIKPILTLAGPRPNAILLPLIWYFYFV